MEEIKDYIKMKLSKDFDDYNGVDDRINAVNYSKSLCTRCRYFDYEFMSCNAFHKLIPMAYITGEASHRQIDNNQDEDVCFTER